ncbi:SNF2 family N-terminal domain-containing protein, partial [Tricharina praecox]|uniref:SNF2 family N-terminal domain-containing protein n=1 Tax=Tricharina praecox TaxID=43433 RepID=UPI0022211920
RVPAMVTTLMNHQVLGLDWMASRELLERPPVGGLVADEMGLGKTMQSIAVMLLNPPEIHDVDYTPVTLIVAPLSLLRQWKEEIINHCKKRTLRVFIHHGDNRIRTARDLRNIDVVLCTYNAIMYSWPRRPKDGKRWTQKAIDDWWEVAQHSKGIFHRIKFWRVILDECHLIKNRAGATSEACQQLSAVNKWALSGTPIPNSLYDLFPIFSFIGHPTAGTIEGFRWLVGTHPSSAAAAQRVQAALRGNMMRRTKSDFLMGLPLISLPRKRIRMVELEFSDDERALYKAVELHSIDRINKYMREGKEMKEFAILTMLLRLRQMCDHPYLVCKFVLLLTLTLVRKRFHIAEDDEDEKSDVSDSDVKREQYGDVEDRKVKPEQSGDAEDRKVKPEQSGDAEDRKVKPEHSRGFEDRNVKREYSAGVEDRKVKRENSRGVEDSNLKRENSAGFGRCKHQFCRECLMDSLSFSPLCPFNDGRCGTMLKEEDILPGDRGDGGVDELNWLNNPNILMMPSTKTTLLRKQLAEWRLNHPGDKIVLFSQFTKMLDIIERVFENEEPDQMYVRYDGSMSVEERDEALGLFRTEPECNLILISIKAGGVGLNLTHANLVICIDLWWNAAVELQAFDRVHRLGQKKEVFVTRCIVKDTVEERMLALQKRKMLIAKAALGEGRMALGRLTRKELLGLFG